MVKRLQRSALVTVLVVLCLLLATAVFCFAPKARVNAEDGDEPTSTVGAEVYYSETADGEKTKLGEYDDFRSAVDAVVANNVQQKADGTSYFYTIEVLKDCTINSSKVTPYSSANVPGGLFAGNDNTTGILLAGDMDVVINGNEHQVVTEGFMRGMRVRGESHVVINDLEIVTCYRTEAKCFEPRGGNTVIELNRVILQVTGPTSQALCFGGSGYIVNDEGEAEIATVKCVAKDCSFGLPVPGTIINGKEVVNYFDKDGDGVADNSNWPVPRNIYGIMVFVKIDLTLDHSASGGYAALYLKGGSSSTGSRNSVINVTNNSYLRGYNQFDGGAQNTFGAVVFEGAYTDQTTYLDYDNDNIIDDGGTGYATLTLKDGTTTTFKQAYDSTSNIAVNVVDSTVESTTINQDPANQYCFQIKTCGNRIDISGDSAITTDDKYRNNPTKAVEDRYYGQNNITITGGTLYKWEELPAPYIKSDAAIGDKLYATFADAMANAADGDTVSLVRSITVNSGNKVGGADYSAVAQVASGKNVTVDLNGKTVTVDSDNAALALIVNDGELTLTNGTIERVYGSATANTVINRGTLTLSDLYMIDRTTTNSAALIANVGGVSRAANNGLNVVSGTYTSNGGNVVENGNGGLVTITGGTLVSRATGGSALVNSGSAVVEGGSLRGANALVVNKAVNGETEINGGVFSGGIVTNDVTKAEFIIRGGTFDATVKNTVLSYLDDYYQLADMGSTVTVTRFIGRDGLVYTGKEYKGVGINELLADESVKITADMTVEIIAYTDADGNEAALPTTIKDAGTYTLEITLSGNGTATVDITVARKTVSLQYIDFSVVKLGGAANNIALASMTIYKTGADNYVFYTNAAGAERIDVVAGVVRWTGSEIELGLTVGVDNGAYTVELDGDSTANAVGKYEAWATLTANPNYNIVIGDEQALVLRGLEIEEADDGVYMVCKTWYVADAAAWFVDSLDNEYAVPSGHTFGQTPVIPIPWMSNLDVPNADITPNFDDPITLTLTYNGQIIAENFRRYQFATYINESMPVGEYVLTINGNVLNANAAVLGTITSSYNYEVYPATAGLALNEFLTTLRGESGNGNTFTVEWDGYMHMFDEATQIKLRALQQAISDVMPERKGCWLDNKYDDAFGGLIITYNLDRMHNSQYYEENALAGFADRPAATGMYTVYYNLSAKNFVPFIELDSNAADYDRVRRNYVYNVVIVRGVDIPTVNSVVYNGNAQMSDIVGNEFYTVDEYSGFTDGGVHKITLRLRIPEYYYWKGHELGEETVTVDFEITKASNDFTIALNMLGWNYKTFDAAVNNIRAAVRYLDDGEAIHFRVVKTGETVALDGLADFTVDGNGRVSEAVAAAFNVLKVGEYTLYAKVNGTNNYYEYERDISFAVGKAINSWADGDDDLKLPSWIVGKYDVKNNAIVVNALYGDVNIIITDINGKEYYNSATGLNKLNECEVGKYLLKAWVEESENYAGLAERTFTIEVLEKVGLPWWATLLITLGALLLAALIIFILWKKGVFQILTEKIVVAIRTKASVDATIASVRAAKKMEEGKQSVADAKRRERIAQMRERVKAQRAMPPEERAAMLEERAKAHAERAEKNLARSEAIKAQAAKLRGETPETAAPTVEAAAAETTETPTEE